MRTTLASLGLLALTVLGGCSSVATMIIALKPGVGSAVAFIDSSKKGIVVLDGERNETKDCKEEQGLVPWVIHYDANSNPIETHRLGATAITMSSAQGDKFVLTCAEAAHANQPTEVATSVAP